MARWASIGTGVMATALITGAVKAGHLQLCDVTFADCDAVKLDTLSRQGYVTTMDNNEAVRGARYVLLGVRPHQAHDAVRGIARRLTEGMTLVSICAGVTAASLKTLLPDGVDVVRVMPNLPATVGAGVTAIADPLEGKALCEDIRAFFECSGVVVGMEESLLNAATAISGSGPGYFFKFAAAMQAEAERLGFPPDTARKMISGTMKGAALMLNEPGANAAELSQHVAVPGGTTEAAFQTLDRHDFDASVGAALARCAARAGELAR